MLLVICDLLLPMCIGIEKIAGVVGVSTVVDEKLVV